MTDKLRIELKDGESRYGDVVAIEFTVEDGLLTIFEHWDYMDEIYSDGVRIEVPRRVWDEALPWILEKMK